ncbi:PadR family transcriptional regulator [uncultured Paludibaculum sp.]|uniref:PadR family transcriptional regulator n=1 Tax=uncultured Paludibaculum sp. TaxID=1765020 RepID=UPI002AAC4D30|nr:PadR family transcriptional regulator [uncultured Paludibaculum sp.]
MGDKTDKQGELLQGTLDLLILKTLTRGPKHGYAIVEWIQQTSESILRVEEGALYPALHRLELKGWLSSDWGVSENKRRAKYYALTPSGLHALESATESFNRLTGAVQRILQTA